MHKSRVGFVSGIPRSTNSHINNQILKKCLKMVKSGDDELSPEQMKDALTKIALELQRFRSDTSVELSVSKDNINKKLKIKKRQVKSLKENLNTACLVAKSLTSSKQKEQNTINKHLNDTRNEAANLQKTNVENTHTIIKLNAEKQDLNSKLLHLKSFIELGYKELQTIRKEEAKDLPTELQLKEIIVSCGQYYADFHNEHEKCIQLEQKRRFLGNKLTILERSLEEVTAELKSYQRRQRSKSIDKDKANVSKTASLCSEYKLSQEIKVARMNDGSNILNTYRSDCFTKKDFALDLSSHMSLIKNLMDDQDSMLNELTKLSEDLNYSPS